MRDFKSLSEREVLALAISQEEEDARIYADLADGLKESHPEQAEEYRRLRGEEDGHRHRLLELYRQRFGDHIPLLRRQDVKGFVQRKPNWLKRPLTATFWPEERPITMDELKFGWIDPPSPETNSASQSPDHQIASSPTSRSHRLFLLLGLFLGGEPLLNLPACVLPNDKQAELVLALVELLVGAAHATVEDMRDGGDDERETHR